MGRTLFRDPLLCLRTEENIISTKICIYISFSQEDLTCLLAKRLHIQTERDVNTSDPNPSAALRIVNCRTASENAYLSGFDPV